MVIFVTLPLGLSSPSYLAVDELQTSVIRVFMLANVEVMISEHSDEILLVVQAILIKQITENWDSVQALLIALLRLQFWMAFNVCQKYVMSKIFFTIFLLTLAKIVINILISCLFDFYQFSYN
jgi:hypothetical protein